MTRTSGRMGLVLLLTCAWPRPAGSAQPGQAAGMSGPTLQQIIRFHPGEVITVPEGDHAISETLRIDRDGGGLTGPGRIIMSNPDAAIVEFEHVKGGRLEGVTLTRAEGRTEAAREAVLVGDCRDLSITGVRVVDNHTRSGAIRVEGSKHVRISRCDVINYMSITVDDRTADRADQGYAFRFTDGSGIVVDRSRGTLIEGCTIREERLLPTPELRDRNGLGKFTARNPERGKLVPPKVWEAGEVSNWQQGSAIIVTGPTESDGTRILGNHIENAAQGIDLHADRVIVAHNIVADAFIGMKAMHGSRNIVVTGNQFSRNSLWAIGMMPGVASRDAAPAEGDRPAEPANRDGGSIIGHNIISDFGQGHAAWAWRDADACPFRFDRGQEASDPPLRDVLVTGNVLADGRHDRPPGDRGGPPPYRFAVRVEAGSGNSPEGLVFRDNLFPPGRDGVSDVEIRP